VLFPLPSLLPLSSVALSSTVPELSPANPFCPLLHVCLPSLSCFQSLHLSPSLSSLARSLLPHSVPFVRPLLSSSSLSLPSPVAFLRPNKLPCAIACAHIPSPFPTHHLSTSSSLSFLLPPPPPSDLQPLPASLLSDSLLLPERKVQATTAGAGDEIEDRCVMEEEAAMQIQRRARGQNFIDWVNEILSCH
jgi:hypothetical protein